MKMKIVFISLIAIGLALSSCNLPNGNSQATMTIPPTLEIRTLQPFIDASTITPSPNPQIVTTEQATLAQQPTANPTATNFAPFTISPFANNVKLRTNPGYLFPARMLVHQDTILIVHGRSQGNDWIYVETPEKVYGWVYSKLFNEEPRLLQAPLVEPGDVQIIRGKLFDPSGRPISGVQFAITQGSGDNPLRNDAITDENGEFIAFMPLESSGTWTIAYVAIGCNSNTMDSSCNCMNGICGKADPESIQINLPTNDTLQFTWK